MANPSTDAGESRQFGRCRKHWRAGEPAGAQVLGLESELEGGGAKGPISGCTHNAGV